MGFICICLHRVRALVVEARDHEVMRRAPPDARSRRAKGGARHERQRLRKRVNPNAAGSNAAVAIHPFATVPELARSGPASCGYPIRWPSARLSVAIGATAFPSSTPLANAVVDTVVLLLDGAVERRRTRRLRNAGPGHRRAGARQIVLIQKLPRRRLGELWRDIATIVLGMGRNARHRRGKRSNDDGQKFQFCHCPHSLSERLRTMGTAPKARLRQGKCRRDRFNQGALLHFLRRKERERSRRFSPASIAQAERSIVPSGCLLSQRCLQ